MTVQNLDFKVLCRDAESSLCRCAGDEASVPSSNGGTLRKDTYHQTPSTSDWKINKLEIITKVSYLVNSTGLSLKVSHVVSSV